MRIENYMCYKKLEDILDNLEKYEKMSFPEQTDFEVQLALFKKECENAKRRKEKVEDTNATYLTRDISRRMIKKYGLYGALDKIKSADTIVILNGLLRISLTVIELEILEILTATIEYKLPRLMQCASNENLAALSNLLQDESMVPFFLGEEEPDSQMEQLSFLPIAETKPKILPPQYRDDIYLRVLRCMTISEETQALLDNIYSSDYLSRINDLINIINLINQKIIPSSIKENVARSLTTIIEKYSASPNKDTILYSKPNNLDQASLFDDPSLKLQFIIQSEHS